MRFDIVTIFPGFFAGIFEHGVVKRAIQSGLLSVGVHDLREFTHDRHRTVDDRPYGGGPGMVLKVEPMRSAVSHRRPPFRKSTRSTRGSFVRTSRIPGSRPSWPCDGP